MIIGPVIAALLLAQAVTAVPDLWERTDVLQTRFVKQVHEVTLPPSRQKAIANLIKARHDVDGCEVIDPTWEWLKDLNYSTIPLAPGSAVYLVEAGAGCARGAQGSNGAMWIVRFDRDRPTLLASPKENFEGWIFAIEPFSSHGYRDIIVGWHASAYEAPLAYFRFDGKFYRAISYATLFFDPETSKRRLEVNPERH